MNRCLKCKKDLPKTEPSWEGLHTNCFCEWFGISEIGSFQDVIARRGEPEEDDAGWEKVISSFFHGKFRKYSARLGSTHYILKVEQQDYPELPAMEYLCNEIARKLKLIVPNFYLIRFEEELVTFACYNFMQNYPGSNLVHIYRFLQSPDQYNCENLLGVIEKEVRRHDAVVQFIHLSLFDALIGNHDRHGRNLGLIQSGKKTELAPFYDNPSYLALEHPKLLKAFHEPRGAIATKLTKEPTMSDYVKEWKRLGWGKEVETFAKQINIDELKLMIENSFISYERQEAITRLIDRRNQELSNAI